MDSTDWIGRAYLSRFGWDVLEDICEAGPRLGGSDGETRAHRRVQQAFEDAGCRDIGEHTFEITGWERGTTTLAMVSAPGAGREIALDAIALPGSPGATIEAEVVHVGYGRPSDFARADCAGKIVVARSDVPPHHEYWIHRREKYGLAHAHGARAFVFANHVEGCLPPTGSLGSLLEVMGPIPGVGVSMEVGERVRRYCQKGPVRARLDVAVTVRDSVESRNVFGVLGPDTDTEILVGAHVDGHDISQAAMDNGAGVAITCEVARILGELEAGRPGTLGTRVRMMGWGSEELGLIGAQRWAADHDRDQIRVVVNLDGIGRGRNLKVHTNGFDAVEPAFGQVAREFGHPIDVRPDFVVHSDHWPFAWRGIPAVMVASETGHSGRGYGHTFADTLDKVDVREIRSHAILVARLLMVLADPAVDLPHRTPEATRALLEAQGYDHKLKAAGEWPYAG